MSDEKWWFGLVARTFSKMCPTLGINKGVFAVHHKKHISKVTGDPDNGGEGVLLGLNCCQAYKVAQRSYLGKGGHRISKRFATFALFKETFMDVINSISMTLIIG